MTDAKGTTPAQARELAIQLNIAATNAEVLGHEFIDLQNVMSARLRESLDSLQAAIDAKRAEG